MTTTLWRDRLNNSGPDGDGDDTLTGGAGADTLVGGTGFQQLLTLTDQGLHSGLVIDADAGGGWAFGRGFGLGREVRHRSQQAGQGENNKPSVDAEGH